MYLMKCGHIANGITREGKHPVCTICIGTTPDAYMIEKECEGKEGLEGRIARCDYCNHSVESSWNLPFFKHLPDEKRDEFYCGCLGWD